MTCRLSIDTVGTSNSRDVSNKEEAVKAYLLSPQLNQQHAISFSDSLVAPEHFLVGVGVSIDCSYLFILHYIFPINRIMYRSGHACASKPSL